MVTLIEIPEYLYYDNKLDVWIEYLFKEKNPLLSELYILTSERVVSPLFTFEPAIEEIAIKRFRDRLVDIYGDDYGILKKVHIVPSGRNMLTDMSITEEVLEYFPQVKEVYFREVFNAIFETNKCNYAKMAFHNLYRGDKSCDLSFVVDEFIKLYPMLPQQNQDEDDELLLCAAGV